MLAHHGRRRGTRTGHVNPPRRVVQPFWRKYLVFRPNCCAPKDGRVNVMSRVNSLGLWVLSLDLFALTLSTTD
ncbi:hypothetical protein CSX11_29615 [Mycobacterium goodii]|nr:hypothetical protein CSX11_29615 [Mycolicibacterium goodii]